MLQKDDLIDYYRTPNVKDEFGGWNGPVSVLRNEPDRGQVIVAVNGQEVIVKYPHARLTLYVDVYIARLVSMNNGELDVVIQFISNLTPGKQPIVFGYVLTADNKMKLSAASTASPRAYMAVQYLLRVVFQLTNVIAVRLGRHVSRTSKCTYASCSTLIYWTNDHDPDFQICVT